MRLEVRALLAEQLDEDLELAFARRARGAQAESVGEAQAILFLAGPGASYITGQSLAIDGGLMLR